MRAWVKSEIQDHYQVDERGVNNTVQAIKKCILRKNGKEMGTYISHTHLVFLWLTTNDIICGDGQK